MEKKTKSRYNYSMKTIYIIFAIFLSLVSVSTQTFAKEKRPLRFFFQGLPPEDIYSSEGKEEQLEHYAPPEEPIIKKAVFLKIEPPWGLRDRVDRLLHGIHTDVPPEYDHYGHEMRRYMSQIAGPMILGDAGKLDVQLSNVRSAKIILKYWRTEFMKEMLQIEDQIEEKKASATVRSTFKYNRGQVNAFFIDCQAWVNANEDFLEFLLEKQGRYTYKDPIFKFKEETDVGLFLTLYDAQQTALEHMKKYSPFRRMVY